MRFGKFVLAFGGILSMAAAVGIAQDGFTTPGFYGTTPSESRSAISSGSRSNTSFPRGGVAVPTQSQLKNYHQQLYGTPRPQPTPVDSTEARINLRDSAVRPAAATAEDTAGETMNAEYVRTADAGTTGDIQQIGFDGGSDPFAGKNPFAALESGAPVAETPKAEPKEPVRPRLNRLTVTPPTNRNVPTLTIPTTNRNRIPAPSNTNVSFETDDFRAADVKAETKAPAQPEGPAIEKTVATEPAATEEPAPALSRKTNKNALAAAASANGEQKTAITVEWVRRSEINVGQECDLELVVVNKGESTAKGCEVDAYFPATVRLTSTDPAAKDMGDHILWPVGDLESGEKQNLKVTLIPSVRGNLDLAAYVRSTSIAGERFSVQEPLLTVSLKGPDKVVVGDPATHTIVVANPGTGTAKDVTVEATLPEGLEHAKGKKLAMNIGSLAPNETRVIRLALAATQGGAHQINVLATAGETLRQEAANEVFVVAPSLRLEVDGPGLRYVGRSAEYVLQVTNDGSAPNNNVRVSHKIPNGFEFKHADMSGRYDELNRVATWFVGRLDAGETKTLHLELMATEAGTYEHVAGAISEHGARAESSLQTEVDGIASLVLEVVDLDDPVEVGVETAYEIRVQNVGTKAANNVDISCKLPEGVKLLDARGPSANKTDGSVIFFRPLDSLGAGKTAVFQVKVRGNVEGDQRFRVRLASDSITEPLIFEELTKYYGG